MRAKPVVTRAAEAATEAAGVEAGEKDDNNTKKGRAMPAKMKSVCEGCGGEILYEKDSTGQEIIEANPDEYAHLCGTCRVKRRDSENESAKESVPSVNAADFEDERNRAMRTGGE